MQNTTLLFLTKKKDTQISELCLAMKKRRFGTGKWNGVGGKLLENETIEEALQREASEEINVCAKNLVKVAELIFYYNHNPEWNQLVHVFISDHWDNDPQESEEMNPQWFSVDEIPYDDMWPDDKFWLPYVLQGNLIKASFTFSDNTTIKDKEISVVESL